jgi:hypothetical protein
VDTQIAERTPQPTGTVLRSQETWRRWSDGPALTRLADYELPPSTYTPADPYASR